MFQRDGAEGPRSGQRHGWVTPLSAGLPCPITVCRSRQHPPPTPHSLHVLAMLLCSGWLGVPGQRSPPGFVLLPGNIWQLLETFLVVTAQGRSYGWVEARAAPERATMHRTAPPGRNAPPGPERRCADAEEACLPGRSGCTGRRLGLHQNTRLRVRCQGLFSFLKMWVPVTCSLIHLTLSPTFHTVVRSSVCPALKRF